MKRKFDTLSKETQQQCIHEVITRIEEIGNSTVGVIAAQDIIDIVTEHIGPGIYNLGIRDAKKLLQERFTDMEISLDLLEQK